MDGPIRSAGVTNDENALAHYGVKGMKWGVRRDGSSGGSRSRSGVSEDARNVAKAQNKIGTHGTQALSNKDLQMVITRMNLENQYHNLTTQNTNYMDDGFNRAKKILEIGTTVEKARKFLATPTGKAVISGLKVGAKVAAGFATGGGSGAASAAGTVAVRSMANH